MPAETARRDEQQAAHEAAAEAAIAAMSARLVAVDEAVTDLRVAMESSRADLTAARAALAMVEALLGNQRDAVADLARTARNADDHAVVLVAEHRDAVRRLAATSAAIADHLAATDAHHVPDGPLVSVIVPVRDRPDEVVRALASLQAQTYERWECIVVDDGSEQAVEKTIGDLADDRITVVRIPPSGAGAARNVALERVSGDLVTFLDSDNEWFPARLARVIDAMEARPWIGWAIDGQLIDDSSYGLPFVRNTRAPTGDLDQGNFIDVGSLVVRRRLLDEVGGFDPELRALGDWDLIRRLAMVERPARLPTIGFRYHDEKDDRISVREPHGPPWHRIRRRAVGQPGDGLRVLAAEWHYPQVTESYIEADIQGLLAVGAEVEVWCEDVGAVTYPESVPVHRGSLEAAIEAANPDVVLTHWLISGLDYREIIRASGIPHAIRAHGFDVEPADVEALAREPDVVVHLPPQYAARWAGHPRVVTNTVGFDPRRYAPTVDKDRRLVARVVAGLLTKDVEVFFETAKRCPHHRFVMGVGRTYGGEFIVDQILEMAAERETPAEVRTDLAPDEAAALVHSAGIYLHTHGTEKPFGMPISIAESMATGCFTIVRDLPGAAGYLGQAGALYRGATIEERADAAAALVDSTRFWSDEQWHAAAMASVDNAWTRFAADLVAAELVDVWRDRLGVGERPR